MDSHCRVSAAFCRKTDSEIAAEAYPSAYNSVGLEGNGREGRGTQGEVRMKSECETDRFVRVCRISDLSDPGKAIVKAGDRTVALFRVGGQFWATDERCTHDGGPLVTGRLDGYTIICPRHGARFDIRTGEALSRPASVDLAVHEVKIDGDDVLVRVSDAL
jgi:3-phenylpropionate/trans-cinnamate dioxygenase ferredoxin component